MEKSLITCPLCKGEFALTAAIEQPILDKLRAQFSANAAQKEDEIRAREQAVARQVNELKKKEAQIDQQVESRVGDERKKIVTEQERRAKEAVSVELADLRQQLHEKDKKLATAQQAELDIRRQMRELEEAKAAFELDKQKQIDGERQKIREEARQAAVAAASKEVRELKELMALKDEKLAEAQQAELRIRKQKAELEEQKRAFDLELARNADVVRAEVSQQKDEEHRLKEAESNKKMEDLKRQIDEWRRKSEQGSQQLQGEVLELDLEGQLRRCFTDDEVTPVPVGVSGGDVIHHVHDEFGRECGTILWESKRTKAWNENWLIKLKDDKFAAKAQLAVLVSVTMPQSVGSFECRDNVWIVPPRLAMPLAMALRAGLIETAAARRANEGRQDKMSAVYNYLSGPEFKERVSTIFESFQAMLDDLENEKTAMQKIWAKREKQIRRVLVNTVGLHGDLQGIIGQPLPKIEGMELDSLATGELPAALPSQ